MTTKSNAGTIAAVLGAVAVVGGVAAAAMASGSSGRKPLKLNGARRGITVKKPCGCGR